MEQYTNFAKVYDLFMDNVPYDKWVEQIKDILYKENIYALIVKPNPQNNPENKPNDIPDLFFITF